MPHGVWLGDATTAAVGVRYRGGNRVGRTRWSRQNEIVTADPPHELAWRTVETPMYRDQTEWRIRLEPHDGGTRIVQTFEVLKLNPLLERLIYATMKPHRDRLAALTADIVRLGQIAQSLPDPAGTAEPPPDRRRRDSRRARPHNQLLVATSTSSTGRARLITVTLVEAHRAQRRCVHVTLVAPASVRLATACTWPRPKHTDSPAATRRTTLTPPRTVRSSSVPDTTAKAPAEPPWSWASRPVPGGHRSARRRRCPSKGAVRTGAAAAAPPWPSPRARRPKPGPLRCPRPTARRRRIPTGGERRHRRHASDRHRSTAQDE